MSCARVDFYAQHGSQTHARRTRDKGDRERACARALPLGRRARCIMAEERERDSMTCVVCGVKRERDKWSSVSVCDVCECVCARG